jgi:hypothetical protein
VDPISINIASRHSAVRRPIHTATRPDPPYRYSQIPADTLDFEFRDTVWNHIADSRIVYAVVKNNVWCWVRGGDLVVDVFGLIYRRQVCIVDVVSPEEHLLIATIG